MFARGDARLFARLADVHLAIGDRPGARRMIAAACHLATDDHRPIRPLDPGAADAASGYAAHVRAMRHPHNPALGGP